MDHDRLGLCQIRGPGVLIGSVDEDVAPEVGESAFLEEDIDGEHTCGVLQGGDPFAVDLAYAGLFAEKGEEGQGMDVGDKNIGFQALLAVNLDGFDYAVFLDNLRHCRAGADLAVNLGDEAVHNRGAAALETVTAADEGVADLGEYIEREALPRELELKRGAGEDLLKQGILRAGAQEIPGAFGEGRIHIAGESVEDVVAYVAELADELLKAGFLGREALCKGIDERPVAHCEREAFVADDDLVEAVFVEPDPRQVKEIEIAEKGVERAAFIDAAHVVEAGVEGEAAAAEALEASAGLQAFFKDRDAVAFLRKDDSALEAAEACADNDRVFFHRHAKIQQILIIFVRLRV